MNVKFLIKRLIILHGPQEQIIYSFLERWECLREGKGSKQEEKDLGRRRPLLQWTAISEALEKPCQEMATFIYMNPRGLSDPGSITKVTFSTDTFFLNQFYKFFRKIQLSAMWICSFCHIFYVLKPDYFIQQQKGESIHLSNGLNILSFVYKNLGSILGEYFNTLLKVGWEASCVN